MTNPICIWCKKHGYNYQNLGIACGVSRATIYRMVSGDSHRVKASTILEIHKLTKIPYRALMALVEEDCDDRCYRSRCLVVTRRKSGLYTVSYMGFVATISRYYLRACAVGDSAREFGEYGTWWRFKHSKLRIPKCRTKSEIIGLFKDIADKAFNDQKQT